MTKEELKPIDVSKYTVTESGNVIKDNLKQEAEKFARTEISHPNEYGMYYCTFLKVAEPREKRIAELEKENADLKEEINKIAFARGNLEEENTELKKRNAELKGMYAHSAREAGTYNQFLELKEKENAELKSENQKWKDEWQEQVQKATDEGYARTLQTMQLTKAKELLKQFLVAKNGEDTYKAEWEAEQFLNSEVEK